MKDLFISLFVIFGPLVGTALLFFSTVRREWRNLGGKR
jgi:hypothetical protein